jgi:BMFP domain-containing protein YqiC
MFDPKILDDLAKKLSDAIPKPVRDFEADIHKKFRVVLESAFAKLDLVTHKEFAAQAKVLARTREKLDDLERQLEALQNEFSSPKKRKPPKE